MDAITIGLDIAKSVFQVHGEKEGRIVLRKRLRRKEVEAFFGKLPACLIGIEACGSAHYWARRLCALGHEVRLIPAAYVKPFVRRNKTDARDAAAICAALGRPDMRFVAIKSPEQQASRGLERSRELLVRHHSQLMNSVRSQMAEFGIIASAGRTGFAELCALIAAGDERLPPGVDQSLQVLVGHIERLAVDIALLEKRIVAAVRQDERMRRLTGIPGVGPLTAHAIVAAIGEGRQFASARDFAAWCGMTRRVDQSAQTRRERGISRQGDRRLRQLFALGASAHMRALKTAPERVTQWQRGILARRPVKVAVLAQAAKNARIAWAMLQSGAPYRQHHRSGADANAAAARLPAHA